MQGISKTYDKGQSIVTGNITPKPTRKAAALLPVTIPQKAAAFAAATSPKNNHLQR
jgi:hypothetical protein